MTKFKRLSASIMAAATLATSAMGGITASAANTGNTSFSNFTAPPNIAGAFAQLPKSQDGVRYKTNNSSVYLQLTSAPCNICVQTWGLSYTDWDTSSNKANCTLNGWLNATNSVTVQPYIKYEIYNKIKYVDNHTYDYGYAGLKFCSTNQYYTSSISGNWSPDYATEAGVQLAY